MIRYRSRPGLPFRGTLNAGGGFTPADISGLSLWLDAADPATISQTGGQVSQWNDKSGNGKNATQGTGSAQPITNARTLNGKNGIDFNGSSQWMDLPDNTIAYAAGTDFAVFVPDTTTTSQSLVGNSNLGGFDGRRYIQNQMVNYGQNNLSVASISGVGLLQLSTISGTGGAQTQYLNVNGVTSSNSVSRGGVAAGMNVGSLVDGQSNFFDGAFFEYINYSRVLSNTEINQVGGYLAAKWGVPWSNL